MNNKDLEKLREQIDLADENLLTALARRQEIVREIGKLKKSLEIPPLDQKRWEKVLNTRIIKGKELNLSEELVKNLYILIHEDSLKIEKGKK